VIRDRILRRDCGICRCRECTRTGGTKPAHHVDHDRPLWAGGAEDDSNRISINEDCHKAKSACEAAMRAKGSFEPTACACGRHE
jgi:5-methylcytosine-specific restriction protein A